MTFGVAVSSSGVFRDRADRRFERFRRTGDPRDLAAVFDSTAAELWRVAAHLCRNAHDAEDAVQNTFLAAIEGRSEWDAERPLLPWLLGLLVNRVREQHRRNARSIDLARLPPEPIEDPTERVIHQEFTAAITASLQHVDEPLRSTLEQHLVHGKKAHEIAAHAGMSAGAVRMRIHRGLDQLRRHLPRAGFAIGAIKLPMPPTAFDSVRAAVLEAVPGGAALPTTATLGAFLLMTTMKWLVGGAAIVAAVSLALLWPSTGDIGSPTGHGAPVVGAVADSTGPPAPNIPNEPVRDTTAASAAPRVAAAPATTKGELHIRVCTAWNDAPIPDVGIEVSWGLRPKATAREVGNAGGAPTTAAASAQQIAAGRATATTDTEGRARLELPLGRARIGIPAFGQCPAVEIDVGAADATECVVRVPAAFTGKVRVVADDDVPVAGARILGRAVTETSLVEHELGITDSAGRWTGEFASRYLFVRAVARWRAASAPVALSNDATNVTLRVGDAAAVVHGTVFAADGAPLAGAVVLLHARAVRVSELAPIALRTSSAGTFTCDYLPPGPCLVLATHNTPPGRCRFTLQDIQAAADSPTRVELRFPIGARLTTKLRRANGDSGGHSNVTLAPRHKELPPRLATLVMSGANTDSRGDCVLDGLFPGPYEMRVSANATDAPSELDLRDGEMRELVVTLATEQWIEVEVVDDAGKPLAGWVVALDGDSIRQGQTLPMNGRARFDHVAAGPHEVVVLRRPQGFPVLQRATPTNQRTRLVVPRSARALHSVRGTLAAASDIPLDDLRVVLMSASPQFPPSSRDQVTAVLDPATRAFAFESVPSGSYHLMIATRLAPKAMRTDLRVDADVDLGPIELGTGGIDLQLTRSDGQAVREPVVGLDAGNATFTSIAADASTGLLPRDLPAATYRLLAWGRDVEPVIVPVTVRIGERTPLPITMRAATEVPMQFEGATARGSIRRLTLQRGGAPFLSVLVDPSQPFARGLAPGSYHVECEDADGSRSTADFQVGPATTAPVVLRLVR